MHFVGLFFSSMPNHYTMRANWDKSKHTFFNLGIRRYSSVNIAFRMPLFEGGGGGGGRNSIPRLPTKIFQWPCRNSQRQRRILTTVHALRCTCSAGRGHFGCILDKTKNEWSEVRSAENWEFWVHREENKFEYFMRKTEWFWVHSRKRDMINF